MKKVTVVGGQGFIGSAVSERLHKMGSSVYVPEKNAKELFSDDLGVVIYCAGNGDCLKTPFKVYGANTDLLAKMLEFSRFDRLIYLSSTRVYVDQESSQEDADIQIGFKDPRRLFNLTKILSEELCQKSGRDILVLRPSNIYGPAIKSPLFLPMIVKDALLKKQIDMYVQPGYSKDYLSVKDLVDVIVEFVGQEFRSFDILNVASGENTSAEMLAKVIAQKTACKVIWHEGFSGEIFPVTSIDKLRSRMEFKPQNFVDGLEEMIEEFSKILGISLIGKK